MLANMCATRHNPPNMGWFQRLFSGADGHDADYRGTRSPDQARVTPADLAGELRALHNEIKLLRESIGSGGRTISDSSSSRNRRGGRSRIGGRDQERDRNQEGGGHDRDRERERPSRTRVGFDGEERTDHRPPQRRSLPKVVPDDAPVGLLVDYLKTRGVVTYEGQDDLNRNEAFEHLARHLGMHFHLLANFYEKVKRCVATGRGQRIDIDGYSHAERSAAVQLGTLLHRHGMLKDFYYHRSPKRQLRVIPTRDGQVGQFLTGGWLEIYVSAVLTRRLRASKSAAKFQLLYNVKGMLPDGREFEADLMAAVEGRLFWLECKTGQWQDYSARFRGLVKIFGVERESAALLLIKPPDANTRSRATDMLDMTLLSLDEVENFISVFLGEPLVEKRPLSDAIEGAYPDEFGKVAPLTVEEIPLEDAAPARKLGRVNLSGEQEHATGEGEDGVPRRRRRRRGGRNRSRSSAPEGHEGGERTERTERTEGGSEENRSSTAANAEDPVEGRALRVAPRRGRLLEPLPIARFEEEDDAQDQSSKAAATEGASTEGGTAEVEAEVEAVVEKPRRTRRRRPTPFAVEDGAVVDEKAEQAEVAALDSGEQLAAEAESEQAEGDRPKRKRSRRRRTATSLVEDAVDAEPLEGALLSEQEAAIKAEAEAEAEAEVAVKVEPEPTPAPTPEPTPEPTPPAAAPVRSVKGVTIAPDLAAMMAGSKKPKGD